MINRDRRYSYEFVKVILQTLNPVDKLLFIKKQVGDSAGLFAVACKNVETFGLILQSLSSDDRLKLLQTKEGSGTSTLHRVTILPDQVITEMILKSDNEKGRQVLLSIQEDMFKYTPIHLACYYKNTEVLAAMIRLTTEDTWYKLLQIPGYHGNTPLHTSSFLGNTHEVLKSLANSVTAERLIHLLRTTNNDGDTPLQYAKQWREQAAAELLQDYLTKALINVALQQTEEAGADIGLH